MAKTSKYDIPFSKVGGHQLHFGGYGYAYEKDCIEWRANEVFNGVLTITGMERGRSAAYFIGEVANGHKVTVFMTDLLDMLPHMTRGSVAGMFTYTKRGQNYGCKLVKGVDE